MNFKNKKVLILGLGVNQGGVGSARFFAEQGSKVKVTDLKSAELLKTSLDELEKYPDITYTLGKHTYEDIDWADLIIRNPALKPDNEFLLYAQKQGKQVEMDLGILLRFVNREQLIGVTGTKGKSSTASMIYEVLYQADLPVLFAGNIGKSVLDVIPHLNADTLLILELSSFQLQAFEQHHFSPKYAVITNIYPDHLNYHGSMEEYVKAKKAIAAYQTSSDQVFLNKNNPVLSDKAFTKDLKGQITFFSPKDLPADFDPLLPGEHNLYNFAAALAVAKAFKLNEEEALATLMAFKGVEFRLQLIHDENGIKIYNDTTATNPSATVEAIRSLPNSILIVGGMDKDMPYDQLAHEIERKAKAVYFIEGTATDKLKSLLRHLKILRSTYSDFETLLRDVKTEAKKGDKILFSPAATSYNMFQNEFDRGRHFNQAVAKIF